MPLWQSFSNKFLMFNWFKKKAEDYFAPHEKQVIVDAIKQAEKQTSGEVRVFIESKCEYVNAIDRAKELFGQLDMHKTEERNAVIVYVALKHHQVARLHHFFDKENVYAMLRQFLLQQLQCHQHNLLY